MTLILELPDNKEGALKAKAQAQGVSAEQYVERMLDHALEEPAVTLPEQLPSIAHLQLIDPKAWVRELRAWAESHDRNTPLLSDEAISRASIYPDRLWVRVPQSQNWIAPQTAVSVAPRDTALPYGSPGQPLSGVRRRIDDTED